MNALERLLQNDLNHLLDRIAATIPAGMLSDGMQRRPELTLRLGEAEARLSAMRQSLLRDYAVWRQAIEECGDVWALVDLAEEAPRPGERCAA
jgi:hypothetical protein